MDDYRGMRWFRCDLQVQTPEDGRHWDSGDPLRIGSPGQREEQDLQDKARRYLKRCHEVGLEVIGVTDHNFCSHRETRQRFLTHLIEQNRTVAEEMGKSPLWIFPGFEVDIGFHVLCLFPPLSKCRGLEDVCDVLSQLGLPPPKRFDVNGPADLRQGSDYVPLSELLKIVQEEHGGIVVAAHAFQEDGIADGGGRWAEDYRKEELLAVEVSGFPLGERERAILESGTGKWARSRPPAYIQSSDAKSTLLDDQDRPRRNSIGYRWTWIKMSEPSIEALRQAFLDPGSRIRQRTDVNGNPEDPRIVRHARIESVDVRSVIFLADQEIHLSPHLNCIIGGRGSGKSSLFEYVRFALRREDDPAAAQQVSRIRETLTPSSTLTLKWCSPGDSSGRSALEDIFRFDSSGLRAQVLSREVVDPATVFRSLDLQILSQGEITAISKEPGYVLSLVDGLAREELRTLDQQETALRERLKLVQQERRNLERLRADQKSLEQEVADLDRQWQARSALQEEQKRYRGAQEARRYIESLRSQAAEIAQSTIERGEDIAESHSPLGSAVENWPRTTFFEKLDEQVEAAKRDFAGAVRRAAETYRSRILEVAEGAPEWPEVRNEIQQAEKDFLSACERQGLRPQDLDQVRSLDTQRTAKAFEVEARRRQAEEIERRVQQYDAWREELHAIWRGQTKARQRAVEAILESEVVPRVPVQDGDRGRTRPSLEAQIGYSANREHFLREWQDMRPPMGLKTRLGKIWDEIGSEAFAELRSGSPEASPWQVVEGWLTGTSAPPRAAAEQFESLREYMEKVRELWESKILTRISDSVDLVLYRPDGSKAGSIAKNQLSEGQRNTAILTLLLADGKGPILIDQPEEELDSNFIFEQLVPLLRKVKEERQIVLVTHNPNLPVNADAELVYALQAEAVGEGQVRGTPRAQGGLDRAPVKEAVLDIMEGSEAAFVRRREKYHF